MGLWTPKPLPRLPVRNFLHAACMGTTFKPPPSSTNLEFKLQVHWRVVTSFERVSRLRCDRLLPNPFQLAIHQSSYHLTLYADRKLRRKRENSFLARRVSYQKGTEKNRKVLRVLVNICKYYICEGSSFIYREKIFKYAYLSKPKNTKLRYLKVTKNFKFLIQTLPV